MAKIAKTYDERTALIKNTIIANKGEVPVAEPAEGSNLLSAEAVRTNILLDLATTVKQADSLRGGSKDRRSIDYTLADIAKQKFGFGTVDSMYQALGINPSHHTMESLSTMNDFNEEYRWLQPEIIREAVRLGLRRNPVYPDLIAGEETVDQTKVTMPHINMSDATPEKLGEAETIPVGSVSFGEKDVKLHKLGTGLQISDEVQKYVSLNILSLYLQDVGVKLGLGMDTMAVDTLLNGDYGTGNDSAPVIGVETIGQIKYYDLLRAWIRTGRIGKQSKVMLSNEDAALSLLQMDEFKGWSPNSAGSHKKLNIKTPIPQSQNYLIHGAMPAGQVLALIDNTSAMLKLNATALQVESERIVRRQLNGTYVTITTGFARLFKDAVVLLDGTQAFATAGFPDFMDVNSAENIIIK